jgi:hypothetical protein
MAFSSVILFNVGGILTKDNFAECQSYRVYIAVSVVLAGVIQISGTLVSFIILSVIVVSVIPINCYCKKFHSSHCHSNKWHSSRHSVE